MTSRSAVNNLIAEDYLYSGSPVPISKDFINESGLPDVLPRARTSVYKDRPRATVDFQLNAGNYDCGIWHTLFLFSLGSGSIATPGAIPTEAATYE